MPWETESASRLSSALCCPGREREVTVGLQISFINHRTRVRENKVSRSHGSWAGHKSDKCCLASWRQSGIAGKREIWHAGANSLVELLSVLRKGVPFAPKQHARVWVGSWNPHPHPADFVPGSHLRSYGSVFVFCFLFFLHLQPPGSWFYMPAEFQIAITELLA